jgi:predicted nucleic acid-binding protein
MGSPMSGRKRRIYWDTCVFLAWIKAETVWPEDVLKGISQSVEEWRSGRLIIVTSAITLVELQSSRLTKEHHTAIAAAFGHPGLQLIDLDRRISGKAAHVRNYYDDRVFKADGTKTGKVIGLGDAIHLATAIHIGVDEFQTLDGTSKNPRKYDLLRLGDVVADARLVIRVPAFIAPPEPLKGPLTALAGDQPGLFDLAEELVAEDPAASLGESDEDR